MSYGRSAQYLRDFSVYGKKAAANKPVSPEKPIKVESTPKTVDATSKSTNSNAGRGFGYR